MIKTKGGLTTASGTKAELLKEFSGTAEALMRRAPITAEELIKAVKTAEMFAKIADLIDGIEEIDEGEESITVIPEEEEPEAENKPAEAEEKPTAKKGAVKATVLEADDIDGMLEWLKGELENLEDETELERLLAVKRSIFTEMAACERIRSSAMENYCRKGDEESKVMYAYFDGAFHTIWNLIKENHLEVEYHEFTRARQRAEKE